MGTAKGYMGQYADVTGLDYYNARYYDPVVGLFLSVNTVQDDLHGFDPYAYVRRVPVRNTSLPFLCMSIAEKRENTTVSSI